MPDNANTDGRIGAHYHQSGGVCPKCQKRFVLGTRIWKDSARPRCPVCGRALLRMAETKSDILGLPSPQLKTRRCRLCRAKLSRYNHGETCFPCSQKAQVVRV